MTKKLLGRFSFEGENMESIENCLILAMEIALKNGWDDGKLDILANYLNEQELPHMTRVPKGIKASLAIYKERGNLQAFVGVDESTLSREQLINIIRGPETDGGKMSPGDKRLLHRVLSGRERK